MYCKQILGDRGGQLFTATPATRIADAAWAMSEQRVGALVVLDAEQRLVGILSERDVTRAVARHGAAAAAMPVADFMTADVAVCGLDDHLHDLMRKMNDMRVRHLPVVENGRPVGMVSIRDVIENLLEETVQERDMLRDYVASAAC